jgi:RimJ/RimL family protein N-acetyltransferase
VAKHNVGSIRVLEKCGFTISDDHDESAPPPDDGGFVCQTDQPERIVPNR